MESNVAIKSNNLIYFYSNNTNSLFDNEQQEIYQFLNSFIDEKLLKLKKNPREICFYLNYYHDRKFDGGKEFEIDSLATYSIKNKTIIFIFEYKNYSNSFTSEEDIEKVFFKLIDKSKEFKNYFFEDDKKAELFFIFGWKDNNQKINFKISKINKNSKHDFKKNNDIRYIGIVDNYLSNKDCSFFKNTFLENKLKIPRDVKYIMSCAKGDKIPIISNDRQKIFKGIKENRISLFEGEAGSGKTALAFFLFGYLKESIFFLINDKFSKEIIKNFKEDTKLNHYCNRIIYHTNDLKKKLENTKNDFKDTFLLIDESQRITKKNHELLVDLIEKNKNIKIILFGDQNQMINPDSDFGYSEFIKYIKCLEISFFDYKIQKCYRIPKKSLKKICFVLCLSNDWNISNDYIIEVENNLDNFVNKFLIERKNNLSVMSSIQYTNNNYDEKLNNYGIRGAGFNLSNREYFLHNDEYLMKNYFFPYDLLSREIDSSFIFIPGIISWNSKNCALYHKDKFLGNKQIFLKNQLYVLASRSTKKIVIYIENKEFYDEVSKRLNKCENINKKYRGSNYE